MNIVFSQLFAQQRLPSCCCHHDVLSLIQYYKCIIVPQSSLPFTKPMNYTDANLIICIFLSANHLGSLVSLILIDSSSFLLILIIESKLSCTNSQKTQVISDKMVYLNKNTKIGLSFRRQLSIIYAIGY